MVFLFVLISSLLKNTILFSWLIDGFLILKFYLIFSLFGCFFCIIVCLWCFQCCKIFSFYNSKGKFVTKHLRDIKPVAQHSKVLKDVFFTRSLFKTNIVVPTYSNHPDDIWYLVTNDNTSLATKNYSYRFGSIECIFKSQKSNGFRLESTNTKLIDHFISLFTIMCISLTWLSIIGADYARNKHSYHIKVRNVHHHKGKKSTRFYSIFNLGLTIFNLCYYNYVNYTLKFNFVLYDV